MRQGLCNVSTGISKLDSLVRKYGNVQKTHVSIDLTARKDCPSTFIQSDYIGKERLSTRKTISHKKVHSTCQKPKLSKSCSKWKMINLAKV